MTNLATLFLVLYCLIVSFLTFYGINCHVLVFLFKRRLKQYPEDDQCLLQQFYQEQGAQVLPTVTSQIPIYNEMNVAERVIEAVAAFEYPEGRHEIQVLDDSTDKTTELIARKIETLKAAGVRIEHIRRTTREGFKAGALKEGLEQAAGEFLAIFDADFVPPRDFLLNTIPFFLIDPSIGFIQGRWGHLNPNDNLLTRFQSIGINGHFVVEQSARNWNNLFMNFNGTAGIFRKQAVVEAGNWKADTLTEDLDLSYRIQLKGWTCRYLLNVVIPAELPTDIQGFKNQQFRWAKGSIQTALKVLPLVWHTTHPVFKKVQATLHLTHYLVHPLMVYLAVIAPSVLITHRLTLSPLFFVLLGGLLGLSCMGPSRLYWTAERYLYRGWSKRVMLLPLLVCFGCGLALNNSRAVFQALRAKKTEFVRTPKQGDRQKKQYRPPLNLLFLLEITAGLWCMLGMVLYFTAHHYLVGYFLLMYAIGFLYVGGLSFLHQIRTR